jgi:sugar/nucleoside kinase (ribokinase family)
MSPDIVVVGEALVEVMRKGIDQPLYEPGEFLGPYPSGASGIFADAAARLGGSVGFISAIGADDFGRCIRERLERDGIDLTHIKVVPDRMTGVAFVTYFRDGSRKFIYNVREGAPAAMEPSQVQAEYFAGVRWLHIMGFALTISEGCRQACLKAVELVRQAGGRISLDPNLRPEVLTIEQVRELCRPVLEASEIVFPSGAEAMMLAGVDDTETAVRALLRQGPKMVALKQGEQGSTVFTADERVVAPPFRVTEVDPTGAGDCYDAAFVTGLLEGWDLARTARFANAVGALATTRQGPMEGTFSRAEVMAFMAGQPAA